MINIRVDLSDLETRRALKRAPGAIRKGAIRGLRSAAILVVKQAKQNVIRPLGRPWPLQTFGKLLQSIDIQIDEANLTAWVGSFGSSGGARYAPFVHEGRAPGRQPSSSRLELWVKRKLGVGDDRAVRRVAFLVARKIGQQGTQGVPFLARAAEDVAPEAIRVFAKRIEQSVREIG